jgi:hypothetical protein
LGVSDRSTGRLPSEYSSLDQRIHLADEPHFPHLIDSQVDPLSQVLAIHHQTKVTGEGISTFSLARQVRCEWLSSDFDDFECTHHAANILLRDRSRRSWIEAGKSSVHLIATDELGLHE